MGSVPPPLSTAWGTQHPLTVFQREGDSKQPDQGQSWKWFLYGKTENIIKIKIKPVKKASPWSSHLLPLALQRGEALAPGQQRVRAFLPFSSPIPSRLISTVGPSPREEANLGMGAGPEALWPREGGSACVPSPKAPGL